WAGREAHFLRAEHRGDDHIAARFDLAIGLQYHAAAKVVHHERLVSFGDSELPRQAGVLDAGNRRRAGTAGVAGNENVIGVSLRNASGDSTDADFTHQLDADARRWIAVFQVVNELLEFFDRIDVVVRWRADHACA